MMMKLTTLALALLLAGGAHAQARFWSRGAGAGTTCGQWLEERTAEARDGNALHTLSDVAWMQGYLSGLNVQRDNDEKGAMVNLPDVPSMSAMMDNACHADPRLMLFDAGLILYQRLIAK